MRKKFTVFVAAILYFCFPLTAFADISSDTDFNNKNSVAYSLVDFVENNKDYLALVRLESIDYNYDSAADGIIESDSGRRNARVTISIVRQLSGSKLPETIQTIDYIPNLFIGEEYVIQFYERSEKKIQGMRKQLGFDDVGNYGILDWFKLKNGNITSLSDNYIIDFATISSMANDV